MKYAVLFPIFFLTLVSGWVYGQSPKIDSLKKVIASGKSDTAKVNGIIELAIHYYIITQNLAESQKTAKQGLELAEQIDFSRGKARLLKILSVISKEQGRYDESLSYLKQALTLGEAEKDRKRIADIYMQMGDIYKIIQETAKALTCFQKSLKIREELNDTHGIGEIYAQIGYLYWGGVDDTKMYNYTMKALKVSESLNDTDNIIRHNCNGAEVSRSLKDYSRSLDHFNKAMAITEARNKPDKRYTLCQIYRGMGAVYTEKGELDKALEYHYKTLKLGKELNFHNMIMHSKANIGECLLRMKRISEARSLILEAYNMSSGSEQLYFRQGLSLQLSQIDSALGNFKSAYEFHKKFVMYKDSSFKGDKLQEIGKLEAKYQYDKEIETRQKQEALAQAKRQQYYYLFGGVFAFVLMFAGFIYYRYQNKNKTNRLLAHKNQQITAQNEALEEANHHITSQKAELENAYEEINATLEQVQHQKEEIENKNRKIEDSIRYAYQIQTAILPDSDYLKAVLPRHFIFYQPKDIVSGDFYWVSKREDKIFFCVADCTGHGVPGAFMSVVGSNALHSAVNEHDLTRPDMILTESDRSLRRTLRQESYSESKDGMDVALCVLSDNVLLFAGAGRPLYHFRDGILTEIKGDKFPIGGGQHEHKTFTCHRIELKKGDRIYIFSDGITDQFGGTQKRKFTPKRLQEFILDNAQLSLEAQGVVFQQTIHGWMTGYSQLDDLTLIALEI